MGWRRASPTRSAHAPRPWPRAAPASGRPRCRPVWPAMRSRRATPPACRQVPCVEQPLENRRPPPGSCPRRKGDRSPAAATNRASGALRRHQRSQPRGPQPLPAASARSARTLFAASGSRGRNSEKGFPNQLVPSSPCCATLLLPITLPLRSGKNHRDAIIPDRGPTIQACRL